MNYLSHYIKLIDRAKSRILTEYSEIHHIIPKCCNGTDDKENLVLLTPEEHYVAHQLLVKIYPDNAGLVYAAFMMGTRRAGNKTYGWLRRRHALNISTLLSGVPKTTEHKEKLSLSMKGKESPKKGATHTEATKQKISEAKKGIIPSDAARLNMSISQKGKPRSVEDNIRRSIALKGKPKSEETKRKMREAHMFRKEKNV